jgi:hypothetical protein
MEEPLKHLSALLGVCLLAVSGCDKLEALTQNPPEVPTAGLSRVDLVDSPTIDNMFAWSCYAFGGTSASCGLLGFDSQPGDKKMNFSFDLVFDMYNPNKAFPIPLVELLLGITVYDEESLGVVCVSFCDPEAEDCDPTNQAEDACQTGDDTIDSFDDLVPTVDDLVEIGTDVLEDGVLDENLAFRVIPAWSAQECQPKDTTCTEEEVDGQLQMCCGGDCVDLDLGCSVGKNDAGKTCALCEGHMEAHVQFDFQVDTFLSVLDDLFVDAFDALLGGGNFQFVIPYTVDGTLFFDVPTLGTAVVPFGPFDESWTL